MAGWTPALEHTLRALGDYVERQMKDLVNPKASVAATSMRVVFRAVTRGLPLMHNACARAGMKFSGNSVTDLRKLADIADEHKSDAADKIKKALPLVADMTAAFKAEKATGLATMVRLAKRKGIQY